MPAPAARIAAWLAAPLILTLAVVFFGLHSPTYLVGDFRAFYCAGSAIAQGADPYRQEPLRTCEEHAAPPAEPRNLHGVAVPAPLPPHALLLFVPLSRLPFPVAALLFTLLSLTAGAASVALFARTTGASTLELNLVFAAISGTLTVFIGQPVLFVLLALAATAFFIRKEGWWAAGACATAATLEPHVAFPVLVAMLVALPRTRVPLLVCLGAAAAVGVLALGIPENVAYVREVLPAHALANAYEWQYSLTSVLTSVGIDGPLAVRCGEVMFATMTALGVAVAMRVRAVTGDAVALVLVPPAFALFGGVHVHAQQIAAAFPAALYVLVRFPRVRVLTVVGIVFAMIPWNFMCASALAGFAPILVGAFAALRAGKRTGVVLASCAGAIALSLPLLALAGFGPSEPHVVVHPYPPDALAEVSWGDFVRVSLMRSSLLTQWLRIPTLVGLACVLVAIVRVALEGVSFGARVTPVRARVMTGT